MASGCALASLLLVASCAREKNLELELAQTKAQLADAQQRLNGQQAQTDSLRQVVAGLSASLQMVEARPPEIWMPSPAIAAPSAAEAAPSYVFTPTPPVVTQSQTVENNTQVDVSPPSEPVVVEGAWGIDRTHQGYDVNRGEGRTPEVSRHEDGMNPGLGQRQPTPGGEQRSRVELSRQPRFLGDAR
jgi:hypothetical protein